ncbi:MAG: family 10 glycosylhydrolase [candidate division WOR-3 bacterium]
MLILLTFLFGFQRGLWVRALSIVSPDSIPQIINLAEKMDITDLYVQVVISGSAYYKSEILPGSQYLSKNSPPDYEPLDSIIKYAKKKNIKAHAWINTFLVWSLDSLPDSTRHIYYTHPEWLLKDIKGRSMIDYSPEEQKDFGLEGTFIDPFNQEVKEFLKKICEEILKKYKVDGIHFDFIRFPGVFWGINDTLVAGLVSVLDNRDMRWLTLLRYPKLEYFNRLIAYNFFLENRKRQRTIYNFLEQVRPVIKNVNKDCIISCAVFSSPSRASYQYAQSWWEWQDLIDYPVVMSYTTDTKLFKDFLNFSLYYFPSAIMGIGFLWKGMELQANTEINYVRQAKGKGISYFDFAALDTMADLNMLLDSTMVLPDSAQEIVQNQDTDGFFKEMAKQEWIEKGMEYIKYGEELEFARFLFSLSLNPDRDLSTMGLDRDGFLQKIKSDVAGFEYLNRTILNIPDKLYEPPHRMIEYAFVKWNKDSTAVRDSAKKIKRLHLKKEIYPDGMDPLSKPVFEANKGERKIFEARSGIYVFKVKEIKEGGNWIKKNKAKPELLPIYIYYTIKKRFDDLYKE